MEKVPIDKAPSDTISINIRGSKASADTTTKSLRRVGFQLMAVFSLIMIVVIVVARPDNIAIALSLGIWCFVASCAALYCRKYSASIAKLWVLVSCPFAPVIVVSNGLLPASLIPLMALFPIVFLTGKWRLCSMLIIAGSTLLVPFHEGDTTRQYG